MKCRKCGAQIQPNDRFCSQCGAAVKRRKRKKETLYDEHLFRDSFLDKTEEGHHALLVTLTAILIIALLTVGILYLFAWMRSTDERISLTGLFGGSRTETEMNGEIGGGETSAEMEDPEEGKAGTDGEAGQDEEANGENGPKAEGQEEDGDNAQAGDGGAAGTENGADSESDDEAGEGAQPVTEKTSETETSAVRTEDSGAGKKTEASGKTIGIDAAALEEVLAAGTTADAYAMYVIDLKTGQTCATSACETPMFASATITVPILYTAASLLDQGVITMDDRIVYVNSIGGRGEPDPDKKDGKEYTLGYYLSTMLRWSDNNCMNCLIDYLTLPVINDTCRSAGYESVDLQRAIVAENLDGTENYICAKDLAGMVRELYEGHFQTIGRDFMTEFFHIDETDANYTMLGTAAVLPPDVMLLNQNGWGETRMSEVAVISDASHEFIVSVMLSGSYGFTFETALEDAMNLIYTGLEDNE